MAKAKKVVKKVAKKKVEKKQTFVAMVIDRSGSMTKIRQQAFENINEQINSVRTNGKKGGDTRLTYIQFDDYEPRGCTALYDSVWAAIETLKKNKETKNTAYLVVVITDGVNNASTDITQEALREEIKRLEGTGKWTFSFMMANIDVKAMAANLNLNVGNTTAFIGTVAGAKMATATSAHSMNSYFTNARAINLCAVSDYYTPKTGGYVPSTSTEVKTDGK